MLKTTIINTFASEDDCDMFIMVLKQQWPNYIEKLQEITLEIVKDTESPNRMLALWTFKEKSHQKIIQDLGEKIIIPYRDRLAPKTITNNWEVEHTLTIGKATTAPLPTGFLIGISIVMGVISGGSISAFLLPPPRS